MEYMETEYREGAVEAALMGKEAIFRLAENLALGIPKQQGQSGVTGGLKEVREAILARGGNPVTLGTLAGYRETALHFLSKHGKFLWVPKVSYTAHQEAYHAGISAADFNKNPRTAREIRQERGKASKDGDPTSVVDGWSEEQKLEAARQILSEQSVAVALDTDGTLGQAQTVAHDQRKDEAEKEDKPEPKKKVRDWDAECVKAGSTLGAAYTAWQEGEWTPKTTTLLLLHAVRGLLTTEQLAAVDGAVDGDMLVEDIYAYLEGIS